MKNLLKKIALLIVSIMAINSAKSYGIQVTNNAPCAIMTVTVLDAGGNVLWSGVCNPGVTVSNPVCPTTAAASIDFTEAGATCVFSLSSIPSSGSCAACTCPCINSNRTFSATYSSAIGCAVGLSITINEYSLNV